MDVDLKSLTFSSQMMLLEQGDVDGHTIFSLVSIGNSSSAKAMSSGASQWKPSRCRNLILRSGRQPVREHTLDFNVDTLAVSNSKTSACLPQWSTVNFISRTFGWTTIRSPGMAPFLRRLDCSPKSMSCGEKWRWQTLSAGFGTKSGSMPSFSNHRAVSPASEGNLNMFLVPLLEHIGTQHL